MQCLLHALHSYIDHDNNISCLGSSVLVVIYYTRIAAPLANIILYYNKCHVCIVAIVTTSNLG